MARVKFWQMSWECLACGRSNDAYPRTMTTRRQDTEARLRRCNPFPCDVCGVRCDPATVRLTWRQVLPWEATA